MGIVSTGNFYSNLTTRHHGLFVVAQSSWCDRFRPYLIDRNISVAPGSALMNRSKTLMLVGRRPFGDMFRAYRTEDICYQSKAEVLGFRHGRYTLIPAQG